MIPYTPPEYEKSAFNCPHCGAYASQNWYRGAALNFKLIEGVDVAYCSHCKAFSLWLDEDPSGTETIPMMIYPSGGAAPLPNPDLPKPIEVEYEEARAIVGRSPKGAAALLRLAIQCLCEHLGEKSDDLNAAIGSLVKKGLLPAVQQSLDAVRVIGNEQVHPGTIDLRDDPETATILFDLVNLIADQMITRPKQVKLVYDKIPNSKKQAILKRDGQPKDLSPAIGEMKNA